MPPLHPSSQPHPPHPPRKGGWGNKTYMQISFVYDAYFLFNFLLTWKVWLLEKYYFTTVMTVEHSPTKLVIGELIIGLIGHCENFCTTVQTPLQKKQKKQQQQKE